MYSRSTRRAADASGRQRTEGTPQDATGRQLSRILDHMGPWAPPLGLYGRSWYAYVLPPSIRVERALDEPPRSNTSREDAKGRHRTLQDAKGLHLVGPLI